jgi:FtsZ-interacting cell division protein ZipA
MSGKHKHRSTHEYLRYLKGELSREERHAFERDLEADPFLQEAMEGMEALDPRELEEDLLSMHANLQKRMSRRRRLRWYYAAASVASLLIVGTIFLTIYNINPKTSSESIPRDESFLHEERSTQAGDADKVILKDEGTRVPDEAVVADKTADREVAPNVHEITVSTVPAQEVTAEVAGKAADDQRVAESMRAVVQEPAPEAPEILAVEAQPQRARKKTEVEEEVIPEQDAAISAKAAELPEQRAAIPEQKADFAEQKADIAEQKAAVIPPDAETRAQGRRVSGIVISAENQEPLPGASILVKGTDSGIVAGMDGRFTVTADPQTPPTVIASFVGMEPGEYRLDENKENQLVLQPDPKMLNEVVVMDSEDLDRLLGAGTDQNISADNQIYTYQGAEPEGGLDAFKMYIEEQIRFPAGDTLNPRGVVVLKFNISGDGTISGIQTLRSTGEPFTREAVRLLQQGPAWKPARDENGTTDDVVRMRIVFKK